MPMLGQISATCETERASAYLVHQLSTLSLEHSECVRTFSSIESSTSGDGAFFEVATTIPFVAAKTQGVNTT